MAKGARSMTTDSDSIKTLARSVTTLSLLMVSGQYSVRALPLLSATGFGSCENAVRWAAAVTLLAGFYYLNMNVWCRCRRRRRMDAIAGVRSEPGAQTAYTDVPQTPPVSDGTEGLGLQQMTAAHVYVYVYGWGVLMFASLYCMAGLHEGSSCWWALGMCTLCLDDLIMRDTKRRWVVVIGTFFLCTVVSLWWETSGAGAKDESFRQILLGTVLPVMSPFIFFSLRSSVRAVTRDVWRLCELALPFTLLISACVLTGGYVAGSEQWSQGRARRVLNETVHYTETQAEFLFNRSAPAGFTPSGHLLNSTSGGWEAEVTHGFYLFGLLALTPVIAAWCIHIMVWSVVCGYVTEFMASFLLVLSVKSSVFSQPSGGSMFAIACSGTCFVLIFLMRKIV